MTVPVLAGPPSCKHRQAFQVYRVRERTCGDGNWEALVGWSWEKTRSTARLTAEYGLVHMAWWPSFFGSREETVSPVRVQFVLSFPPLDRRTM